MLKGKRTYLVGTLALLGALAAWLSGEMSAADALQVSLEGLIGMTLRAGITNTAGPDRRAAMESLIKEVWWIARAHEPTLPADVPEIDDLLDDFAGRRRG